MSLCPSSGKHRPLRATVEPYQPRASDYRGLHFQYLRGRRWGEDCLSKKEKERERNKEMLFMITNRPPEARNRGFFLLFPPPDLVELELLSFAP